MRTKSKLSKCTARLLTLVMTTVLLLSSSTITAGAAEDYRPELIPYRNVMYYGNWTSWEGFYPSHIPGDKITHLNYAFLDFDANANLVFTDKDAAVYADLGMPGVEWAGANAGILSGMQLLRANNPNLRIGVSIGGWTRSGDFSVVAASPTLRAKLIQNLCKYIKYNNMDFLDVDWEYPGTVRAPGSGDEGTPNAKPADKANYITLLREMKAALNQQGAELGKTYELSVAIPAAKAQLDTSIDIPALFSIVDFANIMTYDMAGTWNPRSGHHTALYTNPADPYLSSGLSVDASVNYLKSKGAKASKIVVGCAFYTRGFIGVNETNGGVPSMPGLFGTHSPSSAPFPNGGEWSYRDLGQLKTIYPGIQEYWDSAAHAPYMYDKATGAFFSYDNVRSVTDKMAYVKANGLGGAISWMQSHDKETTPGSPIRDELTKALKEGLYGIVDLPEYNISSADIEAEVTVTPIANGFSITIRNTAVANESDTVLKAVEFQSETIKLPKVYIKSNSGATYSAGNYSDLDVTNENGYGVVDFADDYDNQTIEQNTSVTFQVLTSGPADVADIQSIEISQRIATNGPEISRQLFYGGGTGPIIDAKPVITGANDVTIQEGAAFDALQGVTASDQEDGNLTSAIVVTGTVDTNTPAVYQLTYEVTDSAAQTTTVIRKVTVTAVGNTPPVITGVANKTINVGDTFDPLQGVSASDAEDGAITNITVTGTVNTAVAGTYTLTYAVTDSDGATTTVSCVITVRSDEEDEDTYDPNKIYHAGDTVTYNGETYVAKWWVQGGGTPDVNAAWEKVNEDDGPIETYDPGKAYSGGSQVVYEGNVYQAKWWTQGDTPGSSDVWQLIGVAP